MFICCVTKPPNLSEVFAEIDDGRNMLFSSKATSITLPGYKTPIPASEISTSYFHFNENERVDMVGLNQESMEIDKMDMAL